MDNKKTPKNPFKYACEICNFNSNNKKDYNRHLQTKKHNDNKNGRNDNTCVCGKKLADRHSFCRHKKTCKILNKQQQNDEWQKNGKKWQKDGKIEKCPFLCVCGKGYKQQCSLSKHKKTCQVLLSKQQENQQLDNNVMIDMKEMFKEMLIQNSDIINKTLDIAKEPKIVNNQFNVMNYLNTECKDAMNLSDFINDFTFSLEDLEILGTQGYQKAMEQTFVKQLKDMEKTKRPIHCSDKKRKTFYIKDNDIWEKDVDNKKLVYQIKKLSGKHYKTINTWRHNNVDWLDNDLKHDFFNKSVVEVGKCDTTRETNKVLCGLSMLSLRY